MRRSRSLALCSLVVLVAARGAAAQTPPASTGPAPGVGEKYVVEFTATFWEPSLTGSVRSDRIGLIGSSIDFVSDLGFGHTSHGDVRFVVRPAKKHKFRVQYTPVQFAADAVLSRDVTFAGQVYSISLPIQSSLDWSVLRIGYEWDFFYRPRGYVGVLIEARKTDLTAAINSIVGSGQVSGSAPIPALGFVGRVYPIANLAVNFEVGGLKLTDLSPEHAFTILDLEASATYNFTRYVGASGGWRRMNTNLRFDLDQGALNFAGFWFGGVVRY